MYKTKCESKFQRLIGAAAVSVCALLLTGCAGNPVNHAISTALNGGKTIPEEGKNNFVAVVSYDESYIGDYHRIPKLFLYHYGVREDTPEYQYRTVVTSFRLMGGLLWHPDGDLTNFLPAMVPDRIGRLYAWDIVEVRRQVGIDGLENFSKTNEGNIILRVLCRRADADYQTCIDALPRAGDSRYVGGYTGNSYPASSRDYGFVFTRAYDEKGKPLRPLPAYKPKPAAELVPAEDLRDRKSPRRDAWTPPLRDEPHRWTREQCRNDPLKQCDPSSLSTTLLPNKIPNYQPTAATTAPSKD